MDKCVLSCSSFHAIGTSPKLRARTWRRGSGATTSSRSSSCSSKQGINVVSCCLSQPEDFTSAGPSGDVEDERFPHLSPKPKPVPVSVDEERLRRDQEDDEESKRILTFLQNFPDKPQDETPQEELPDPGKDGFREEMRKRLLYSEPPPARFDDEDEKRANMEFDMFEHLVLTIRHILHLRYSIGERLGTEDELILLEEAIPYHPEREFKVGVGIEYIKVDVHPEFGSRCFFIVRTDKSEIDFSYRKCMMGLAEARPNISVERARDLIYFFRTRHRYSVA